MSTKLFSTNIPALKVLMFDVSECTYPGEDVPQCPVKFHLLSVTVQQMPEHTHSNIGAILCSLTREQMFL